MHILRQIFWIRLAIVLAGLFGIAFIVVFEAGIATVRDADHWNAHTGDVLNAITAANDSTEAAVNAGSLALMGQPANTKTARDAAFDQLDRLRRLTIDNPRQTENIDTLSAHLQKRFELQDAQASTALRVNGTITLNSGLTADSIDAKHAVEQGVTQILIDELILLKTRDGNRTGSQWQVIWLMRLFGAFWLIAIVAAFYSLFRELRFRKQTSEVIETKAYAGGISREEAWELVKLMRGAN